MAHICMVPFNALGSATDASKFALRVTEMPIIHDYLSETNGIALALLTQVPNEQDWWDTVDQRSYARVLSTRHKGKPSYERVMRDPVKWPDISTFDGPSLLQLASGGVIVRRPWSVPAKGQGRNEIYEIKPNNEQGLKDALKKLDDVEVSYKGFRIERIYQRGIAYPRAVSKRIRVETVYQKAFDYLINLALKPTGVTVTAIWIEVRRPEAGVLLYKICVDLDGADHLADDLQFLIANFAVRMLFEVDTQFRENNIRLAALVYANSMKPDNPAIDPRRAEPVVAGRDLRKTPYLTLTPLTMAGELTPKLGPIRDAMYSRLMGTPGDRYLLCSDDPWFQANVIRPGAVKAARQVQLIDLGSAVPAANGTGFIGLAVPLLLSGDIVLESLPWIGPVYRVLKNPKALLIISGCAITITAAVLAIVFTDLAAAPDAVPVIIDAASLAGETVAGAAGTATGAGIGTTGMAPSIMATVTTTESTALSAAPVSLATESAVAAAEPVELVTWTRQALQAGPTEAEVTKAAIQQVVDKLLVEGMKQPAVKTAIKYAAVAATMAVIGLSTTTAHAYTGQPDVPLSAENIGELLHTEVGLLYAIRVPKALPTQIPAMPTLYTQFNADDYVQHTQFNADDYMLLPSERSKRRLWMLGCIEVR